jgi:hypothetical protein
MISVKQVVFLTWRYTKRFPSLSCPPKPSYNSVKTWLILKYLLTDISWLGAELIVVSLVVRTGLAVAFVSFSQCHIHRKKGIDTKFNPRRKLPKPSVWPFCESQLTWGGGGGGYVCMTVGTRGYSVHTTAK